MSNVVKYLLIALGIGGAYYLLKTGAAKVGDYAGNISLKIQQFGKPSISGNAVTVPLVVRINNPTLLMAPIQSVAVKLFFLRNGIYTPFGSAPPTAPFQVKPNNYTDVTIFPTVDISKLNPFTGGKDILSQVNNLITGSNPLVDLKAEVTINVQGFETIQEATKKVYLTDFIKNVA